MSKNLSSSIVSRYYNHICFQPDVILAPARIQFILSPPPLDSRLRGNDDEGCWIPIRVGNDGLAMIGLIKRI